MGGRPVSRACSVAEPAGWLYRAAVPLALTIVRHGPANEAASSSISATAVAPHDDQMVANRPRSAAYSCWVGQ